MVNKNLGQKIAVLALQGAFKEHIDKLGVLGAKGLEIRNLSDLEAYADFVNENGAGGIILPGGESTAIIKLLDELNMRNALKKLILDKRVATFGTCAGLVLMAQNDSSGKNLQNRLEILNIKVKRNAYGRQLASFNASAIFNGCKIPMVFIRAPKIVYIGGDVEVLCQYNGDAVAIKEGNCIASAFHPELTKSNAMHKYFLDMAFGRAAGSFADI